MINIKKLLKQKGKTANDFISEVCDERKNHDLWKYKGNVMIRIDANHGSGSDIFIDERLKPILDKFLKD